MACISIAGAWVSHINALAAGGQLDAATLVNTAVAMVNALETASKAAGDAQTRGLMPVDAALGSCLAGVGPGGQADTAPTSPHGICTHGGWWRLCRPLLARLRLLLLLPCQAVSLSGCPPSPVQRDPMPISLPPSLCAGGEMPHPQAAVIYVLRCAIINALPEGGQRRLLEALAAQAAGSIAVPVAVVCLEGGWAWRSPGGGGSCAAGSRVLGGWVGLEESPGGGGGVVKLGA